ncbi:MAG TPA: DegT/DnrJ/EryC1/StrS aminotransferase family protein [Firmicutes bacterium]|jgi:dTDP-4-amino-4,6-dideoxygalactose transaminase|nr:DegT/DnrJ/EryC1/StrS aminotransferase family protein [Bacillota bacterium]
MTRKTFLPFSPPSISEDEIKEVVDTLRSDWLTTGPKTKRFEEAFRERLGSPAALALNSCTAALHLGLAALGVGRGDEVITTTMTFAASANIIEHLGGRPVLVDVEPDTLNIDPAQVEEKITTRTKVILPVHFAGHPAAMDQIFELAGDNNLGVLEDAAHALPAVYRGKAIGSGDNPAAFSFYATKNLTTAEGGMLTGSEELLEQARVLSLHGMSRDAWKRYEQGGSWYYEVVSPGYKYNMTDIQAALGLHQLRRLEGFQRRRGEVVRAYNDAFSGCEALELPVERAEVEHAWHLYVLRLRPEALTIDRDQFIRELESRNIGTSVHFIPVHLHPYYRDKYGYAAGDFPVAYENYRRLLSLPLSPRLTNEDLADVIEAVLQVVKRNWR